MHHSLFQDRVGKCGKLSLGDKSPKHEFTHPREVSEQSGWCVWSVPEYEEDSRRQHLNRIKIERVRSRKHEKEIVPKVFFP